MAVPTNVIDPNNPPPTVIYALDFSLNWVNNQLCLVPSQMGAWTLYELAVYNLAGDTLINIAQDATPFVIFGSINKIDLPYWKYIRERCGVLNFVAGVVQSTSDEV